MLSFLPYFIALLSIPLSVCFISIGIKKVTSWNWFENRAKKVTTSLVIVSRFIARRMIIISFHLHRFARIIITRSLPDEEKRTSAFDRLETFTSFESESPALLLSASTSCIKQRKHHELCKLFAITHILISQKNAENENNNRNVNKTKKKSWNMLRHHHARNFCIKHKLCCRMMNMLVETLRCDV